LQNGKKQVGRKKAAWGQGEKLNEIEKQVTDPERLWEVKNLPPEN